MCDSNISLKADVFDLVCKLGYVFKCRRCWGVQVFHGSIVFICERLVSGFQSKFLCIQKQLELLHGRIARVQLLRG